MASGQGGAHTEANGGHKAPFPPFQSATYASQLFWFAIAFVLLYLIMSRLALPRVGGVIGARKSAIDTDLAEASRLKDESDAALKAYETDLANARAKAQTIGAEIRQNLNTQAEAERKSLEERLASQLAAAEKTIATTKQTAMGNVRGIATDTASAIVERLTGSVPDNAAVNAAVDASLKG